MAKESEDGGEKTEDPTGRRLNQAQSKGDVALSREVAQWAGLAIGCALLISLGSAWGRSMVVMVRGTVATMDTPDQRHLVGLLFKPFLNRPDHFCSRGHGGCVGDGITDKVGCLAQQTDGWVQ